MEVDGNVNFSKTLQGATGASFCRMKLERVSKCQEESTLCNQNKIKHAPFRNFRSGHRISNISRKNLILMGFEDSFVIFVGKV